MPERILACERLPRSRLLAGNIALVFVCALPASAGSISSPHALARSAIVASALTATAPPPVFVKNCSDHDSGSLREAFANAIDGTVIDLTQLKCGTITLTTGEIGDAFGASNVAIVGNGQIITRDATKAAGRIIHHYGNGTLELDGVTITNGQPTVTNPYGGCILSLGHLKLNNSYVTQCKAISDGTTRAALGGAIWTYGIVTLNQSVVSHSMVSSPIGSPSKGYANGGGIYSHGVNITASTISFNNAAGNSYHDSQGGGIFTSRALVTPVTEFIANYSTITLNNADEGGGIACDNMNINHSMITFNNAAVTGGGILGAINLPSGDADQNHSYVFNSTVSENYSAFNGGGMTIQSSVQRVTLISSTISRNHAHAGAGVYMQGNMPVNQLSLENTILAGNVLVAGGGGADIGGNGGGIAGDHNIILDSTLGFPSDTIRLPPILGPLQYNGGITETLALLPGSPAIDHGINNIGFAFDQRGPGFPRILGKAVDIGAFESSDTIFANGFDPSP